MTLLEEVEAFSLTYSKFKTRLPELKKASQAHLQQGGSSLERARLLINKQEQTIELLKINYKLLRNVDLA